MTDLELARLVELSEARAYASLLSPSSPGLAAQCGLDARWINGAAVLRATSVRTSLVVNRVIGLGVAEPVAADTIDRIVAHFASEQVAFGIELSPYSRPELLRSWLRERRMRKALSCQILYRDGSAPRPIYDSWVRSTGLKVVQVDESRVADLARLSCENFRVPAPVEALLAATAAAPQWRHWLALDGDEPVGGSLSFVEDGVCWLGWLSVLPSHRGRWVHAGILARQLQNAHDAGCSWVTAETAFSTKEKPDASYFNLRQFGFRDAYLRPIYVSPNPRGMTADHCRDETLA